MKIYEDKLRNSLRENSIKSDFAIAVGIKFRYKDHWGFEHYEHATIYGSKNIKTVAIEWRKGYKFNRVVLGKVTSDGLGYAKAAELIESYFDK